MNKKIIGAVIVTAVICVSGWNISRSMNETTLSDMALENVEALAQESGTTSYQTMGYCGFWFWTMDYKCTSTPTAESCRRPCS
ncbi:MAG: NVEALA domain-containing protein [Prevotellaceae bacterium]|jgi:hypothetical protein|nr:NVEALA domain-containing protein [Prevotellaceae bacterium]